jgi:hypothetical protein
MHPLSHSARYEIGRDCGCGTFSNKVRWCVGVTLIAIGLACVTVLLAKDPECSKSCVRAYRPPARGSEEPVDMPIECNDNPGSLMTIPTPVHCIQPELRYTAYRSVAGY